MGLKPGQKLTAKTPEEMDAICAGLNCRPSGVGYLKKHQSKKLTIKEVQEEWWLGDDSIPEWGYGINLKDKSYRYSSMIFKPMTRVRRA